MLQFIADMPSHVLGIHATGKVTKEDIKTVLVPRMDKFVKKYGELYYLLILETNVGDFTTGALLLDIKAGLRHYGKWKKIAVVTDKKSIAWFSDVFRLLIPGNSKGFPLNKLDEAIIWVSAKE